MPRKPTAPTEAQILNEICQRPAPLTQPSEASKQTIRKNAQWDRAWNALFDDESDAGRDLSEDWCASVPHVADMLREQGFSKVVSDISERLKGWLGKCYDGVLCDWPLESYHVPSRDVDDRAVNGLERVFVASIVLQRAIGGREPLVPKSIDPAIINSTAWHVLRNEVARAPELPKEPQKSARLGRCGNGHEWNVEGEPTLPIRCPICEPAIVAGDGTDYESWLTVADGVVKWNGETYPPFREKGLKAFLAIWQATQLGQKLKTRQVLDAAESGASAVRGLFKKIGSNEIHPAVACDPKMIVCDGTGTKATYRIAEPKMKIVS